MVPHEVPDLRERRFLMGLAAALAVAALLVVLPYAGWVLFALFLGYIAFPLRLWLTRRRAPRWLAAGAVTLAVTAVIIAPVVFILSQLADELAGIAEAIGERGPDFFVARVLRSAGVPQAFRENVVDASSGFLSAGAELIVPLLGSVAVGSILSVFLLYAILADGDRLVTWLRKHAPLSEGRKEVLMEEARRGLDAIVFGVIAVAVVQGFTAAVGWWLFGLPEPIFWGFVLVVASLIPYVGAYIVLFPATAWLFASGETTRAIGFLLFAMLVVGTVDNVARPILIGKRSGIHPGIVLVGVVGGVPAFGPMGIVVGPLVLALLLAVLEVVRRPERAEREGREIIDGNGVEATQAREEARAARAAHADEPSPRRDAAPGRRG